MTGDPAELASRRAEVGAEAGVHAVGIGPGDLEYLTARGRRLIQDADVVVGFSTVVEFVEDFVDGTALKCGYTDEGETLDDFAGRVENGEDGVAVLMGDPNHSGYQFLGKVERAVDVPVEVVPGVSSLQVAASRARTPMEESTFVTLHKSGAVEDDLQRLHGDVGGRHLLVLPRPWDLMPEDVAVRLLERGAEPSLDCLVMERLTHEDEEVTRLSLDELAELSVEDEEDGSAFSDLSVLVVRRG